MPQKLALLVLILLLALSGCRARPVTGGTKGTLRAGGELQSEIQITIHQADGGTLRQLGFAVSTSDGTFELVQNEARGPLNLTPGEYRCTLESAGNPLAIPREYFQAETTPLKVSWTTFNDTLDLEIPGIMLPR